jgi:hypothetical protein
MLVLRSRCLYISGKAIITVASSNPFSRQAMVFDAFSLKSARMLFNSFRAVTESDASKSSFGLGFGSPCSRLGQLSRILRLKWVWHLFNSPCPSVF